MGRLQDIAIRKIVNYLAREGEKMAHKALATKDALDVSLNQADAFGYVVYFNGAVKKKGYALPTGMATESHRGWDKIGVKEGTGREWLDEFTDTWKPESKGFILIVVNAAFYSAILEQGRGGVQRKYRIISQIWGDMENIQKKFKGAKMTLKMPDSDAQ